MQFKTNAGRLCEKIKDRLSEGKGSMYIETAAALLCIMLLLLISLSAFGAVLTEQKIDSVSDEITRMVEVDGRYDSSEEQKALGLLCAAGLENAQVSCSVSGDIQLDSPFVITVTGSADLGIGGIRVVLIPLRAVSQGNSDVYSKSAGTG